MEATELTRLQPFGYRALPSTPTSGCYPLLLCVALNTLQLDVTVVDTSFPLRCCLNGLGSTVRVSRAAFQHMKEHKDG